MKRILILALLFAQISLHAQTDSLNIRNLFKQMPDSLMPYLTSNNRLDMMDFMDAKMKAAVDNKLGGESEMLFLSDDSLCLKLSEVMTMELKLQKENSEMVILMKRTYIISEHQKEELTCKFSSSWRLLSGVSVMSTLQRRDDEVFDKPHL